MNTINKFHKQRQAGASLIEAIIFIVISAIVVGAVIYQATKAFSANSESQVVEQVTEISVNIKNLYSAQSTYGASTNFATILNTANQLPAGITFTGGALAGKFGAVTAISNAGGTEYTVTYAGLPQDSCIKIATKIGQGWLGVKGSTAEVTVLPMTLTQATAACSATTPTNTLAFRTR